MRHKFRFPESVAKQIIAEGIVKAIIAGAEPNEFNDPSPEPASVTPCLWWLPRWVRFGLVAVAVVVFVIGPLAMVVLGSSDTVSEVAADQMGGGERLGLRRNQLAEMVCGGDEIGGRVGVRYVRAEDGRSEMGMCAADRVAAGVLWLCSIRVQQRDVADGHHFLRYARGWVGRGRLSAEGGHEPPKGGE